MGFMDKVKGMLGQHGDKVSRGIDKAAETADSKTKGKYSDKIKSGSEKAKDATQRLGPDDKGPDGKGGGDGGSGGDRS